MRGNIAGLPEVIAPKADAKPEDAAQAEEGYAWATTEYVYDITQAYYQVIQEKTTGIGGSFTSAYAYGLERIAAYGVSPNGESSKTSYVYDGRGSVAQAITIPHAGGSVLSALPNVQVTSFQYTAFGEQMNTAVKVSGFTYNAERYDAATGILNLRARQYEPAMNRFSQKDFLRGRLWDTKTLNRYPYVRNDPVNKIDRNGMRPADEEEAAEYFQRKRDQALLTKGKQAVNAIIDFVTAIPAVNKVISSVSNAAKSAVTTINNMVTATLQNIIDDHAPENDPSGRSAMIIADMNLQLEAAQKSGKLTPEVRNRIMYGACTALLDTGSPEVQGMHRDMQYYINQGTTVDDLIQLKRYSKTELNEYLDWFYAGNPEERASQKARLQNSINTYYGGDKQYEQEQLIHALESQYDREIAGAMAIFLLSFSPFDEAIDAIQVGYDLAHGDVGGALLDGIGFIPIAEGFKYIDDLAGLIKSGKKITVVLENGSEVTATIKDLPKALQQLPSGTKVLDQAGNVIGEIGETAAEVAGTLTKRVELLNTVQNQKLKNAINEIYRPGASVGDGGLADAVRHELQTGELVGGKSHMQKAVERVANLENIIKKEALSQSDFEIASTILDDLKAALEGK